MKYILILLTTLSCFAQPWSDVTLSQPTPVAAGGGESLWISQTTDADWWQGTVHSQKLQVSASKTITRVRVKLENTAGDVSATVGFFSAENAGGTQTGTDSESVTLTGATATWYEFTWSSNPTITGDIFLCVVCGNPNIRARTSTSSNSYVDSSYDYFNDTTTRAADLVMEIYTQ